MSPLAAAGRTILSRFRRAEHGASAVEFAIVCAPFLVMLLYMLQFGLYYMTQSALEAGVNKTADGLRLAFNTVAGTQVQSAAALKSLVVSNGGGGPLLKNDATLAVEIRQLASLSGSVVPIADGTADYGSTSSVLVLRAQSSIVSFAPGLSRVTKVTAASIVRRQGR